MHFCKTGTLLLWLLLFLSPLQGRERLVPFVLPDSTDRLRPAVIVCPGGSYSWHDMQTEGVLVAEWLNHNGFNAYVLRYRVATVPAYIFGFRVLGIGNKYPDMLNDVEDALRYVYEHAEEQHVDTNRIGVMGFSAGGHLTLSSFAFNHTPYRPKFLVPVYPVVTFSDPVLTHKRSRRGALGVWRQWNTQMQDSLSIEKHIRPDCPPVFLVACQDDPVVRYENSLLLDSALTANNVPHRFCLYTTGGHGFGASNTKGSDECRRWKDAFLSWFHTFFK